MPKFAKVVTVMAFAVANVVLPPARAAADTSVPCSGDDSACKQLSVTQHGVDEKSGVHVVLELNLRPGQPRQSVTLELFLAKSKAECGGNPSRTIANVDPGSGGYRSLDGYLCRLRATWLRR
jgi:hypothetical protein